MSAVVSAAEPGAIEHAAAILRRGGLVAFPTETVYGLGANALDAAAVRRIFEAKGRPEYNPIIVHVPNVTMARALAQEWPAAAERLAAAFWPGPLTLVLPKRDVVPDIVTAGRPAVGLRIPSHPVALALLTAATVPIAAPSANRSTEVSPTTAAHVCKGLDGRIDLVLDGGPTDVGIESTVLDLSGARPTLLRPGLIALEELERHVGPVARAGPVVADAPRLSPGMLDRHYAPRTELRVIQSVNEARSLLERASVSGPTGALVYSFPDLPADHLVRLPASPAGYSRGLYAALHAFDDLGCQLIIVEAVPTTADWEGIGDRLTHAAAKAPGPPTP